MLCSINDKLEKYLVKDVYFLSNNVSLYYIAFSMVSVKRNVYFYVIFLLVRI